MVFDSHPVGGVRSNTRISKIKNKEKASASSFSFTHSSSEIVDSVQISSHQALSAAGLQGVDPLFMDIERRIIENEQIDNSETILGELEKLRFLLLKNNTSQQLEDLVIRLNYLAQKIDANKVSPQLEDLLLEVQTRASVELAKINLYKKKKF